MRSSLRLQATRTSSLLTQPPAGNCRHGHSVRSSRHIVDQKKNCNIIDWIFFLFVDFPDIFNQHSTSQGKNPCNIITQIHYTHLMHEERGSTTFGVVDQNNTSWKIEINASPSGRVFPCILNFVCIFVFPYISHSCWSRGGRQPHSWSERRNPENRNCASPQEAATVSPALFKLVTIVKRFSNQVLH